MEYKRLTKRDKDGRVVGGILMTDIAERLAELEDKIEDGTLIELPCAEYDDVYYIRTGENHCTEKDKYLIAKGYVTSILFERGSMFITVRYEDGIILCHRIGGKDEVYFDEKQAEARLRALRVEV